MTFPEFLDMGGYGLYVWGSFGVTALAMVAEPILVRNRRRAQLLRVTRLRRVKRGQK